MPAEPPRFGRYELLAELGKGGMGIVYRAYDPKIGREVALKTILAGVAPGTDNYAELRRRLEREARAAGVLNHPNIVTIYDVGEWHDAFFIAMEYVPGTPLDRIIKSGKALPLEQVCSIIAQVSEGLDYAHSRKVVHRDIKPANLILSEDGRVKIADFGIARLSHGSITQEGSKVGSPSYMSPEQIEGGEIDGRSDFFSLGVVFYQLLTGRKPFRGKNIPAITHAICHKEAEPPKRYNPAIPRRIDRLVMRLLSKKPENRFQSGREIREELAVLDKVDLSSVKLDYGTPPPREDVRERTPPPQPRKQIESLFHQYTTSARRFSVGDPSGSRLLKTDNRLAYYLLASGAVLGLAGLAAYYFLL